MVAWNKVTRPKKLGVGHLGPAKNELGSQAALALAEKAEPDQPQALAAKN